MVPEGDPLNSPGDLVRDAGAVDGDAQLPEEGDDLGLLGCELLGDPHLLPALKVHTGWVEARGDRRLPPALDHVAKEHQQRLSGCEIGDSRYVGGTDLHEPVRLLQFPVIDEDPHGLGPCVGGIPVEDPLLFPGQIHDWSMMGVI